MIRVIEVRKLESGAESCLACSYLETPKIVYSIRVGTLVIRICRKHLSEILRLARIEGFRTQKYESK